MSRDYSGGRWSKFTDEDKLEISRLYSTGMPLIKISKLISANTRTISSILRGTNTVLRTQGSWVKKYNVDESYFEEIDSENKAYWLGFIAADGCIVNGSLEIGLAAKDKEHLVKFLKDLKSDARIRLGSKNIYKISISRLKLVNDLTSHGITERKSLTLKPLIGIPESLYHHYIRGYFDGDGCISKSLDKKYNRLIFGINILGTIDFLSDIHSWIKARIPTKSKIFSRYNYYGVTYGGNKTALKIMDLLYQDATIFLDRKHQRYLELRSMYDN